MDCGNRFEGHLCEMCLINKYLNNPQISAMTLELEILIKDFLNFYKFIYICFILLYKLKNLRSG